MIRFCCCALFCSGRAAWRKSERGQALAAPWRAQERRALFHPFGGVAGTSRPWAFGLARNRREEEEEHSPPLGFGESRRTPTLPTRRKKRCAKRGASCVWTRRMVVPDFRRFWAAERAVRPVGRAGA
eukprot:13428774-Alexandrium_andersonii.AAC.1